MPRSIVNCLLFISLLLLPLKVCAGDGGPFRYDAEGRYRSAVSLDFRGHAFTGICVMRRDSDQIVGAVMNEFGIKAFDFVYHRQKSKVKIKNAIKMLNRWYIRRVLAADLAFLLQHDEACESKHRTLTLASDGSVTLSDTRYHINFQFMTIDNEVTQ